MSATCERILGYTASYGFPFSYTEPNPIYWFGLAHRNCKVAGTFVGGKEDGKLVNVTLDNGSFGGIVGSDMDNKPSHDISVQRRYTVSLKSLFKKFDVPAEIDYMSLDVEGAEELVMQDFPFDYYKVNILTVERPSLALQSILKGNDYELISMLVEFGDTLYMHKSALENVGISTVNSIIKAYIRGNPNAELVFDLKTGDVHSRGSGF